MMFSSYEILCQSREWWLIIVRLLWWISLYPFTGNQERKQKTGPGTIAAKKNVLKAYLIWEASDIADLYCVKLREDKTVLLKF
jgi:hypothetical protein